VKQRDLREIRHKWEALQWTPKGDIASLLRVRSRDSFARQHLRRLIDEVERLQAVINDQGNRLCECKDRVDRFAYEFSNKEVRQNECAEMVLAALHGHRVPSWMLFRVLGFASRLSGHLRDARLGLHRAKRAATLREGRIQYLMAQGRAEGDDGAG